MTQINKTSPINITRRILTASLLAAAKAAGQTVAAHDTFAVTSGPRRQLHTTPLPAPGAPIPGPTPATGVPAAALHGDFTATENACWNLFYGDDHLAYADDTSGMAGVVEAVKQCVEAGSPCFENAQLYQATKRPIYLTAVKQDCPPHKDPLQALSYASLKSLRSCWNSWVGPETFPEPVIECVSAEEPQFDAASARHNLAIAQARYGR